MNISIKHIAAAAALTAASMGAFAQSVNFVVTGQLVPAACTLTLAGGSAFAFGAHTSNLIATYPVVTLNGVQHAALPATSPKYLIIGCDQATKVKLSVIDSNAANASSPGYFGLGVNGASNIGSFELYWSGATVDGVAQTHGLYSDDSGTTWASSTFNIPWAPTRQLSVIKSVGATLPEAFTSASLELRGTAYVNKSQSMTSTVNLAGSGTITLTYL